MASNRIENLKDIVVDGLAGSVKTYLPILNRPPCRQCDWLSADRSTMAPGLVEERLRRREHRLRRKAVWLAYIIHNLTTLGVPPRLVVVGRLRRFGANSN